MALQSEASIYEIDFPVMSYIMANDVREEFNDDMWTIESPHTVNLMVDRDAYADVLVDGSVWPAYFKGRVVIPKGRHTIAPFSKIKGLVNRFNSGTRIVDLSGELISAEVVSRGVKLEYEATGIHFVVLTDIPREVFIDGKPIVTEILKNDYGYTLRLAAGKHRATIYTQTAGTQFLRHASMIISGLIVFIGISAGTLLSMIYLRNAYRRQRRLV